MSPLPLSDLTSTSIQTADCVQVFQLETSALRGRLVRLGPVLDQIIRQHAYPPVIARLLGEGLVTACALATALKYDGVFTLQAKGDGAVRMLVADVTSEGGLRAYVQFDAARLPATGDAGTGLLGKGYLAFTVMQQERDRSYQGIVELQGGSLAEAVQHYFRQSEQLPTGIIASCRQDEQGHWQAGCLLLQQMPRDGGHALPQAATAVEDDWLRAMTLMGTCTPLELTDPALAPEHLLFRLFHEEGVRVFAPQPLTHTCRCSTERVAGMLQSLPPAEIEELAVDGVVDVTCEFCNRNYRFDEQQRQALYQAAQAGAVSENS